MGKAAKGHLIRTLAARISTTFVTFSYEILVVVLGVLGPIPFIVRLDHSDTIYDEFPDWVPLTWTALMVLGGIRLAYGLHTKKGEHIYAGSICVSVMMVVHSFVVLVNSQGTSGWFTLILAITMVFISFARGIYHFALDAEIAKER